MVIRSVVERLKRIQRPVIRGVQVGILYPGLFLLYFFGFGVCRLILGIFARGLLFHRPGVRPAGGSRWRPAEGYELDEGRLRRQS